MQYVPRGGSGACGVREACSAGISQLRSLSSRASGWKIRNGGAGSCTIPTRQRALVDDSEELVAEGGDGGRVRRLVRMHELRGHTTRSTRRGAGHLNGEALPWRPVVLIPMLHGFSAGNLYQCLCVVLSTRDGYYDTIRYDAC